MKALRVYLLSPVNLRANHRSSFGGKAKDREMKKIQHLFSQETLTYKQESKPRLYYLEPPVWKEAPLTPPTQVQGSISGVALNYFSLISFIESAL